MDLQKGEKLNTDWKKSASELKISNRKGNYKNTGAYENLNTKPKNRD